MTLETAAVPSSKARGRCVQAACFLRDADKLYQFPERELTPPPFLRTASWRVQILSFFRQRSGRSDP